MTSRPARDRAACAIRASAAARARCICAGVNAGRYGDVVAGQQLPRLGVPVLAAAGGRSGRPRIQARAWPVLAPGPGPGRAAAPAAPRRPARPAHRRCRGRTGPRSATPRSAARCPAARAAPHRAGRVDRMPQPPRRVLVPQQVPGLPSRPGSCPSRTRRPAPRSGCCPAPPPPPPGPAPHRVRAARTAARTGSPGCVLVGCTGRCTSRANGSVTSSSGRPATVTPLPGLASAARTCSASWASIPSTR